MKIYTRTGDEGTTGLFGGPRVSKNHIRIEAYGTVDELNSVLGMVRSALPRPMRGDLFGAEVTGEGAPVDSSPAEPSTTEIMDRWLDRVQSELFDLGADLATPTDSKVQIQRFPQQAVVRLEEEIDAFDESLEELKAFILPGGHASASHLHLARTICRRAERRVIELASEETINAVCIVYLNRLSDALFTAARWINAEFGIAEPKWSPTQRA
jgi:cob(I)alamin adenosyltransferase